MVIYLLVVMALQSAIDLTSNQTEPYQNLEYELSNLDFKATFDPSNGDIYLFNNQDRTLITISESG
ncbi:hypothetical protein [Rhodohalobacter sp. 8-1]|uniref:hypothetical protein n=1 Tax=Rhodohalobacter sp. 8-1 TaxID=3131972 RepID=UPI0030EDF777